MRRAVPIACLVAAVACARIAAPPGGPPDFAPPRLLGTTPESLAVVPDFDGWVEFTFDEVISEAGQPSFGFGTGTLERLVMISPDSGIPRVRWRRERLEVRPRDGWRPNTVYRVEIASGLSDITQRANTTDSGVVLTFTTGAPVPTRRLRGAAVEWAQRRFAPRALVEAILLPDSLVYRSTADSAGRFTFGPLPDGEYLVRITLDANNNRRTDGREAWDTVRLAAGQDSVGEVWAFVRDTIGPRLESEALSALSDSLSIAVAFNQPLDPNLGLTPDQVRVRVLPDSTPLPVLTALPQLRHDSIYGPIDSARRAQAEQQRAAARRDSTERAIRDSLTALPDSLRVSQQVADSIVQARTAPPAAIPGAEREPAAERPVQPARPGRAGADTAPRDDPTRNLPRIGNRLVIRLNALLEPGKSYIVELRGVRALSGRVTDSLRSVLSIPEARPRP